MMLRHLCTAVAAIMLPLAANAATITADQGLRSDGTAVAAERSDFNAITDGNPLTFYSLGIEGTLTVDVSPNYLTGATAVEVTFDGSESAFPESAEVWFGGSFVAGVFDFAGAVLAGEIFNNGTATDVAGVADIEVASSITNGTVYTIDAILPDVSLITLFDTTLTNYSAVYAANGNISDGFDVGTFAAASVVPLPAAAWMLLAGLGGLAGMRRFKRAA